MKLHRSILTAGIALAMLGATARAVTLQPAADTAVNLNTFLYTPAAGAATTLKVSPVSGAVIHFGVSNSGIAAASVTSVRLTLYMPAVTKSGGLTINVLTGSGFIETFKGAPLPISSFSSLLNINAAQVLKKEFITVDVTAQVQYWLNNPGTEFGFVITGDGVTNLTLGSKEGFGTGYPATLDVEVKGVSGFSGNTVTPGLTGATIFGGGSSNTNTVTSNFGTVGGAHRCGGSAFYWRR